MPTLKYGDGFINIRVEDLTEENLRDFFNTGVAKLFLTELTPQGEQMVPPSRWSSIPADADITLVLGASPVPASPPTQEYDFSHLGGIPPPPFTPGAAAGPRPPGSNGVQMRSKSKRSASSRVSALLDDDDDDEVTLGFQQAMLEGDFLASVSPFSNRHHLKIKVKNLNVKSINREITKLLDSPHRITDHKGLEVPDDCATKEKEFWWNGRRTSAKKWYAIPAYQLEERKEAERLKLDIVRNGEIYDWKAPAHRMSTEAKLRCRAAIKVDRDFMAAVVEAFTCRLCNIAKIDSPTGCNKCHAIVGCQSCVRKWLDAAETGDSVEEITARTQACCPLCREPWEKEEGEEVGWVIRSLSTVRDTMRLHLNPPFSRPNPTE